MVKNRNEGRGWHGDPEGHSRAGSMQGKENNPANFANRDEEAVSEIARMGGEAAQKSGHAHQLTDEERRRGGSKSRGNFNQDSERTGEAGLS